MKPTESNIVLALASSAATNVPHIAPAIARPLRCTTCTARLNCERSPTNELTSVDISNLLSERIVTDLTHDDVIVGFWRAADALEGKALGVGILHPRLDGPVGALEKGVVEPDRVLPDLRGVAVAG